MSHRFLIEVDDDEEMGLSDPEQVKDMIWEAVRGTGLDNNARITLVADTLGSEKKP